MLPRGTEEVEPSHCLVPAICRGKGRSPARPGHDFRCIGRLESRKGERKHGFRRRMREKGVGLASICRRLLAEPRRSPVGVARNVAPPCPASSSNAALQTLKKYASLLSSKSDFDNFGLSNDGVVQIQNATNIDLHRLNILPVTHHHVADPPASDVEISPCAVPLEP